MSRWLSPIRGQPAQAARPRAGARRRRGARRPRRLAPAHDDRAGQRARREGAVALQPRAEPRGPARRAAEPHAAGARRPRSTARRWAGPARPRCGRSAATFRRFANEHPPATTWRRRPRRCRRLRRGAAEPAPPSPPSSAPTASTTLARVPAQRLRRAARRDRARARRLLPAFDRHRPHVRAGSWTSSSACSTPPPRANPRRLTTAPTRRAATTTGRPHEFLQPVRAVREHRRRCRPTATRSRRPAAGSPTPSWTSGPTASPTTWPATASAPATTSVSSSLNGTEYLEGMLAAFKLRAVPVNINYRYVERELATSSTTPTSSR